MITILSTVCTTVAKQGNMTRFPEYYLSGIVCILSHLIIIITIGIPILQMRKWRNRRTELPQVTQSKCESQDSTRRRLGVNAWIPATVLIAQWKPSTRGPHCCYSPTILRCTGLVQLLRVLGHFFGTTNPSSINSLPP